MCSEITKRFIECHDYLLAEGVIRSSRQFALSLNYLPQSLNEVLKMKRNVTIKLIQAGIETYNINSEYLFTGQGSKFKNEEKESEPVVTIVTDSNGDERILYVPIAAQAGYGSQLNDQVFMSELPSFTLPGQKYKMGTYRCFDVEGDSMEPNLFEGDKIICGYIENKYWSQALKDNHVYVVVTENEIVVKRIVNMINQSNEIQLISDNDYYEPRNLHIEQIREIWYVSSRISPFMTSPSSSRNGLKQEMDSFKAILESQNKLIAELTGNIETLKNQQGIRG